MKAYFAEWLPVEGEIKRGDRYFDKSGVLQHLSDKVQLSLLPNINKSGKLAKLFLCSRDIQVGDKCFCLSVEEGNVRNPNMWIDPWRIRGKGDNCTTCIKVIGEISPEAKWVKEGDEFNENEWRSAMRDIDNSIYVDTEKHIPIYEGYFVEIKGQCGHFH
jgi:hypothetical protein